MMLRSGGRGALAVGVLVLGAGSMSGDAGCSATKPTELVPGATTQVQVPKDLGGLRVIVVGNGQKVFDQSYTVQNGIVILPATLGIVAKGASSTVVTIAMFGYKPTVMNNDVTVNGQKVDCSNMAWNDTLQNPQPVGSACGPSVERGSTQTYVDSRILFLPMPLSYSCWGNDSCTGSSQPGNASQTCKGGQCVDNHTDPTKLADYDPALLDGTQDCFSPDACFPPTDTVSAQAIDAANCLYTFPSKPAKAGLNVRVFYEDLHYDMKQTPPRLDAQTPTAEEEVLDFEGAATEGYTVPNSGQPQTFKLAPGLCSLVQAGLDPASAPMNPNVKIPPSGIVKAITDVQISPSCQSKVPLLPFCANEQNPQGHTIDGGTSSVTCNVPLVLQPAPSAVYLVMDDSAVMSAAFGQQGYATAMSLSLVDPIFKRTNVAFRFLDHSPSDCTASSTPYVTPSVPFGPATDVQSTIAAQLLNVTPPDTKSSPAPLDLQTALRLDQGAYPAVQALQTSQAKGGEAPGIGAVMLFVNRIPDSSMGGSDGGGSNPFPGADCSPALGGAPDAKSAIEQQLKDAANAGLTTFFVVLNDDNMLGSQVVSFYDGIKSDLGGKGVDIIDATSPMSQAATVLANFSKTVTQLGTCLYEVPPGVDTNAKVAFTIPVPTPATGGAAPVSVPVPQMGANPGSFNPNCNAANATSVDGWNIENGHIRICGPSCTDLQATVEFVTAEALSSGVDGGLSKVPEVPVTVTVPCADAGTP
ncbi:MAG TPA: hypothetical protein VF765_21160 [Polyangiaceae bacterium]